MYDILRAVKEIKNMKPETTTSFRGTTAQKLNVSVGESIILYTLYFSQNNYIIFSSERDNIAVKAMLIMFSELFDIEYKEGK